jgi:hypothetical protein
LSVLLQITKQDEDKKNNTKTNQSKKRLKQIKNTPPKIKKNKK